MGDSDEEYDRRRRDKFRRERNDYERRDDRRRENWEERGGGRDNWRGRDNRRDMYNRRERFSPGRHGDISPPQKRMRRDWDDGGGGFSNYNEGPYGGGGGGHMHGGHHGGGGWQGPGDMPPPQHHFRGESGPNQRGPEGGEFPTQPPMQTFKQFLASQDDNISDEDAIKKFNEYKVDFKRQQINEFFLAHKDEEWFKAKYHPEECGKRKEEARNALIKRRDIFLKLMGEGSRFRENVAVSVERQEELIRLLDAAVILMEGGTDFDLQVLDQPSRDQQEESTSRSRTSSETKPPERRHSEDDKGLEEGETEDDPPDSATTPLNTGDGGDMDSTRDSFSKGSSGKQNGDNEGKKKKRTRDYDYENSSDSDSGSDSDGAVPDGEDEPLPPGVEPGEQPTSLQPPGLDLVEGEKEKSKEETQTEEKEKETKEDTGPRALHQTNSIFLRNLAPTITKQEVEAMCKRYPGFMRVALQDPQPERRFVRRGWVTFDRTVNIKDICWNLNNIRLRDCEMGAIVNRELKQRIRPISGITVHKGVVRQDIKHAAKIIQNFDNKWKIWDDTEEEKNDEPKEMLLGLQSKNPVLKNITDYLVEEGSYEEEELLGVSLENNDNNPEIVVERDHSYLAVLDRMILYLRIVHSFDYYSVVEYPNEDEMPHRCGIMHGRGPTPLGKITHPDVTDWNNHFDMKVRPFTEMRVKLEEDEVIRLGRKDHDVEVEKFVQLNTQELAKDKWLCPLSGKKFKGPEFVRKHVFNKHGEKVDEVKKEVDYFNNYLMDPKRPQLPEHPGNRQHGPPQGHREFQSPGDGYNRGPPPQHMGGMGGGGGYHGGGGRGYYQGDYRHRGGDRRRGGYHDRGYGNRRGDYGGDRRQHRDFQRRDR